jgi:hypothetical protein
MPEAESSLALVHAFASGLSARTDGADRAELVYALDDACLSTGARTRLQEAMFEVLTAGLGIDLEVLER